MAGTALNYKPNTTTNDGSTANAAIELATPEALAWYAMKASATGGSSLCATMTSSMSLAGTNYTGVAQADVDANVSKALPWKSIAGTFTGTFTSGGNTVDGLYVYHDKGLFGTVGGAGSISGLSIGANSLIESGAESTGAVAASLEGTASITDCVNAAAVRSTTGVAAGIVYDVQGSATIERCGNAGAITAGSTRAAAGIAGWVRDGSSGSIKNCYNTGAITGGGRRQTVLGGGHLLLVQLVGALGQLLQRRHGLGRRQGGARRIEGQRRGSVHVQLLLRQQRLHGSSSGRGFDRSSH